MLINFGSFIIKLSQSRSNIIAQIFLINNFYLLKKALLIGFNMASLFDRVK